jgi:FtsP/CotA-like multicopper oxidase with cupredoxin domain
MNINFLNSTQRGCFQQKPLAAAIVLALSTPFAGNLAYANGGGYGPNTDVSGRTIDVQTYYANSPQGMRPAYDFVKHTLSAPVLDAAGNVQTPAVMVDTGAPIRKFVDTLGGAYNGLDGLPGMTDLQSGIPVAIKEKWFNPITNVLTDDDYYEIAVVEYQQYMHSDLPKATTLRGYVQIETPAIAAKGLKDVTGLIGSEHIAATYPDGKPIYRMKLDAATGLMIQDTTQPVFFVHKPHFLGPAILASKGTAVRLKYTNYLPYVDANGIKVGSASGGEMPIPVDKSIAGGGPILDINGHETAREFSQNRASIHWHGGDTPWISDGTPHQWIAPAGDVSYVDFKDGAGNITSPAIGTGVSFRNVPDMPDPGQGAGTLYFPNNLSGRMMFYHDHTSGLTRLNVYMGEAAGYVVTDPVELSLVAKTIGTTLDAKLTTGPFTGLPVGTLDAVGIPLVIQDRIYVPTNIGPVGGTVTVNGVTSTVTQSQDAKWDLNHWGQPGDLWYPHVYETNQDPNSWDGTNPTGRWDWGPWFWPVFPSQFSLPTGNFGDVTLTPEAFMDTPTVNGKAYPSLTVEPRTYRFRILNAANDRTQNLSLFQAVDANGVTCNAANAPAETTPMAGGLTLATCTEVKMVPAVPTAGFPASWPTDGRVGGVPDPATAGPDIVQIGSEGGLLPAPAIHKAQPVTFDLDKRSITILNVLEHGVLLGGAERADVLVDFSQFAGKTLILYNDAPTPMPAVDPRTDYFTGMGDMTDAGGSYDPLVGYGPNTRTIMQIKVANNPPAAPLNTAQLAQDLPVAYAKTQPAPLVPQVIYNAPFGTSDKDNYAQIITGGLTQPYFQMKGSTFAINGVSLVSGGSGYTTAPSVTLTAPPAGGTQATATATINANGVVDSVTLTNPGLGYTNSVPLTATFSAPPVGGNRAQATVSVNAFRVINKAIQELFDPIYGRMNATLAVELPFTSQANATTIPLAYIDTPVESLDAIKDGETQIWKITHNGVDSHPVHFHLMNVQLINRVDWAGVIKPPQPGEMGWKETITMNPLEDVYVAARAVRPVTPFGLPTSTRLLDPSQAVSSKIMFTNLDPVTGQTPTFQRQLVGGVNTDVPTAEYSNQMTDFDNEYVWHCHILGHEENDFMRPMIFHPTVVLPDAPGAVTVTGNTVTWTDPTPVGGWDKDGIPTAGSFAKPVLAGGVLGTPYAIEPTNNAKNEIGFKVTRTLASTVTTTTPAVAPAVLPNVTTATTNTVTVAMVPANATSWQDATAVPANTSAADANGVTTDTSFTVSYDVVAYNAAGNSVAGKTVVQAATAAALPTPVSTAPVAGAVTAPTGLTQSYSGTGTTLGWSAVAGASGYLVTVGAAAPVLVTTNSFSLAGAATGQSISVAAVVNGVTGAAASAYNGRAYTPVAFTSSNGAAGSLQPGSITLTWANSPLNVNNVTGLTLTWSLKGSGVDLTQTFAPTSTGVTLVGLSRDKNYNISLTANGVIGNSLAVTKTVLSAP